MSKYDDCQLEKDPEDQELILKVSKCKTIV